MDFYDVIKIILIVCSPGIIFFLPSSMYTMIFHGVFYRQKSLFLDSDDLQGTAYYPYRDELKEIITEAKKIEHTRITIKSDDKLNLVGRYYDRDSDTTVLLVHGYQSTSFNNFSSWIKFFLSYGFNVLTIDQRAHGLSEGRYTTGGCKEQYDLLNWIEWIDKNTNAENVFIYGISMGAATVAYASDKIKIPKVKGLIMESGFTSFYEEMSDSMGKMFMKKSALNYVVLCTRCLLKADIKKRTTESLKNTSIPALFLHGTNDKEVALSHVEASYNACASDKSLVIVEGAGHALCHLAGRETVENSILDFITKKRS